jgi:predicted RNA-binding protein with PIN domain
VIAGFVVFGLGWAALEGSPGAYPGPMVDDAPDEAPRIWLVDGYNAVCAGLLGGRDRAGWWSPERRDELIARVAGFDGLADPGSEVCIVFDGDSPADDAEGRRIRTVFAPSADEWLVRQVRERVARGPVAVVTGDRKLANRVRHRGATVYTPQEFLRRCPERQDGDAPPV